MGRSAVLAAAWAAVFSLAIGSGWGLVGVVLALDRAVGSLTLLAVFSIVINWSNSLRGGLWSFSVLRGGLYTKRVRISVRVVLINKLLAGLVVYLFQSLRYRFDILILFR